MSSVCTQEKKVNVGFDNEKHEPELVALVLSQPVDKHSRPVYEARDHLFSANPLNSDDYVIRELARAMREEDFVLVTVLIALLFTFQRQHDRETARALPLAKGTHARFPVSRDEFARWIDVADLCPQYPLSTLEKKVGVYLNALTDAGLLTLEKRHDWRKGECREFCFWLPSEITGEEIPAAVPSVYSQRERDRGKPAPAKPDYEAARRDYTQADTADCAQRKYEAARRDNRRDKLRELDAERRKCDEHFKAKTKPAPAPAPTPKAAPARPVEPTRPAPKLAPTPPPVRPEPVRRVAASAPETVGNVTYTDDNGKRVTFRLAPPDAKKSERLSESDHRDPLPVKTPEPPCAVPSGTRVYTRYREVQAMVDSGRIDVLQALELLRRGH